VYEGSWNVYISRSCFRSARHNTGVWQTDRRTQLGGGAKFPQGGPGPPGPPAGTGADVIWAVVIAWRIRGKITRTVQCYIVYHNCSQWYVYVIQMNSSHINEQFLQITSLWYLGFLRVFTHMGSFCFLVIFCFFVCFLGGGVIFLFWV